MRRHMTKSLYQKILSWSHLKSRKYIWKAHDQISIPEDTILVVQYQFPLVFGFGVSRQDIIEVRSCDRVQRQRFSDADHVRTDEARGEAACKAPQDVPRAVRALQRTAAGHRIRSQERRAAPRLVRSKVSQTLLQTDLEITDESPTHSAGRPRASCGRGCGRAEGCASEFKSN